MYSLKDWQKIKKDDRYFIINASHINEKDEMTKWPIGMSYHYYNVKKNKTQESLQIGSHDKLVLLAISDGTDKRRRGNSNVNRSKIIETLSKNNINNINISEDNYFISLPSYKFIISPEGNGIDCHRHYEAIMAGCIPIVEHNDKIKEKYENVPILYTTDYTEINEEYLNLKYKEMLPKLYDFSKLFLSNYNKEDTKSIIYNSRFWTMRFYGELYYDKTYIPLSEYNQTSDNQTTFSLAIPTMDRFELYLKEYIPKYINNKYIKEIVICDENGKDYELIKKHFGKSNKIKLFKNENRLGVFKNKMKTMSLCSCDYIALIDSDNFVDEEYFKKMIEFGTCTSTLLFPSKSLPRGNFTSLQWFNPIRRENWNTILRTPSFFPKLNDGNGIYPKLFSQVLKQFNFNIEPHASDAFLFIQLAVSLGFNVCFTDAEYTHPISDNSAWLMAERESLNFMNNWNLGILSFGQ